MKAPAVILLGEVAAHMETLKTLKAVQQVSSSKVTDATFFPYNHQLFTWALSTQIRVKAFLQEITAKKMVFDQIQYR